MLQSLWEARYFEKQSRRFNCCPVQCFPAPRWGLQNEANRVKVRVSFGEAEIVFLKSLPSFLHVQKKSTANEYAHMHPILYRKSISKEHRLVRVLLLASSRANMSAITVFADRLECVGRTILGLHPQDFTYVYEITAAAKKPTMSPYGRAARCQSTNLMSGTFYKDQSLQVPPSTLLPKLPHGFSSSESFVTSQFYRREKSQRPYLQQSQKSLSLFRRHSV